MVDSAQTLGAKETDPIQDKLVRYATNLRFDALPHKTVHAAKVRVIDTLGALIGGFFAEPCRIARTVARSMPNPVGASVIGTTLKTSPDIAAFVNSTTSRFVEANDVYHMPGSFGGHPSDVLMPVFAAAEYARVSGKELITGVVLAYEIFLRISDVFENLAFDHTNFACIGTSVGAGKVLGLSTEQLGHCVAMAVVASNTLRQARLGHLSMFKATASGQAGRSAVFAALLARQGMEGPHLPFTGKAGWCNHIARKKIELGSMGGEGASFKIQDTLIKQRTTCATTISSALAAENAAAGSGNSGGISRITVEVYKRALERHGTGDHHWNPDSRETADHSIPYVTAAALLHGRISPRCFDDAQLWDPRLRSLIEKVVVVEAPEFTKLYAQEPQQHRTRVSVEFADGQKSVGEAGGEHGDLAIELSDAQIEEKFRSLTEDVLGARRVTSLLARLWQLDELPGIAEIPPMVVLA